MFLVLTMAKPLKIQIKQFMKNIIILSLVILFVTGCSKCDTSMCLFKKGDDVEIKNKQFHDNAVVLSVDCGCAYEISYYSYLGIRRHRTVEEVEIEKD